MPKYWKKSKPSRFDLLILKVQPLAELKRAPFSETALPQGAILAPFFLNDDFFLSSDMPRKITAIQFQEFCQNLGPVKRKNSKINSGQ